MTLLESSDEFTLIAEEAVDLGIDEPASPVQRLDLAGLSALAWGDAPASVVLIHGAGLNAHTWDSTALIWGEPALALDLPGHGDSPWRPDADYSPQTIAPAVAAAIIEGVDAGALAPQLTVVGHSLGGLAALQAADRLGSILAALVLVDILPLAGEPARQVTSFLNGPRDFESVEAIVARAEAFGFGGGQAAGPVERRRLERAVRLGTKQNTTGRVAWKHHLGVLGGKGVDPGSLEAGWDLIARLRAPLALIHAERGIVGTEALDRLAAEVPSAQVRTIDSGHNPQEDAPFALAGLLADLAALPDLADSPGVSGPSGRARPVGPSGSADLPIPSEPPEPTGTPGLSDLPDQPDPSQPPEPTIQSRPPEATGTIGHPQDISHHTTSAP